MHTFGGTIFWPWFTLIGTSATLGVAWVTRTVWPERGSGSTTQPQGRIGCE